MKKISIVLLAVVVAMTACRREQVDVKAEFEQMYENAETAFNNAVTQEEMDSIYKALIDSTYLLLESNMGAAYTDSLFLQFYYIFSIEQKQALFEKMPKKMRESEYVAEAYNKFLLEMTTSIGNPYTDIVSLTPEGDELALSDLVGQTDYVLVDFWASWCGPCRRLIPVLKEIYASQPKGRLQIIGCSVDKDEKAWEKALAEEQMAWPQIRDGREGEYNFADKYGVMYIPTTILINKEGLIIARNPDEAQLETILLGE